MEKIEGMLKNLRLSEEEQKGVRFDWLSGKKKAELEAQAMGKVLSEKPVHTEGMEAALGQIWCPLKGIQCKRMGSNIFLITFLQALGKRKAVYEGPWKMNNDRIVLEEFDPMKTIDEYAFDSIPIWIRVFRLPLGMMNRSTGESIGNKVGALMDVEVGDDDWAMGEYLRIHVRIGITKPKP